MGTPTWLASCCPRVLRKAAFSGSTQLSCTEIVDPTTAPAEASVPCVDFTRFGSAPGRTTRVTVVSLRRSASRLRLLAEVNSSRALVPFSAVSSSLRRAALSARRFFTSEVRVLPMSSLSGPAPSTIPTARAMKIETMETRWYRKSIT